MVWEKERRQEPEGEHEVGRMGFEEREFEVKFVEEEGKFGGKLDEEVEVKFGR